MRTTHYYDYYYYHCHDHDYITNTHTHIYCQTLVSLIEQQQTTTDIASFRNRYNSSHHRLSDDYMILSSPQRSRNKIIIIHTASYFTSRQLIVIQTLCIPNRQRIRTRKQQQQQHDNKTQNTSSRYDQRLTSECLREEETRKISTTYSTIFDVSKKLLSNLIPGSHV